jgi:hypothetical protein
MLSSPFVVSIARVSGFAKAIRLFRIVLSGHGSEPTFFDGDTERCGVSCCDIKGWIPADRLKVLCPMDR